MLISLPIGSTRRSRTVQRDLMRSLCGHKWPVLFAEKCTLGKYAWGNYIGTCLLMCHSAGLSPSDFFPLLNVTSWDVRRPSASHQLASLLAFLWNCDRWMEMSAFLSGSISLRWWSTNCVYLMKNSFVCLFSINTYCSCRCWRCGENRTNGSAFLSFSHAHPLSVKKTPKNMSSKQSCLKKQPSSTIYSRKSWPLLQQRIDEGE